MVVFGCGVVFVNDGLCYCLFCEWFFLFCGGVFFGFVVVDVEVEDVLIFDCVCNCVGVEFFLKEIFGGLKCGDVIFDLFYCGIVFEDWSFCEVEELGVWKKFFDSFVVFVEL